MTVSWQQQIGLSEDHLSSIDNGLGASCQVHKSVVEPLQSLLQAAAADGVAVAIVSGFRSFYRQLCIWNEKWLGHRPLYSRHGRLLNTPALSDIEKYKAICLYSALPGMSRHHWGTDIDIFSADAIEQGYRPQLTPQEFNDGPCARLNDWLQEHLEQFDFFRPYRCYRGGVAEEPWHISYRPLATNFVKHFDYAAHREFLAQSEIQAKDFIIEKLSHYREHYFLNIEP